MQTWSFLGATRVLRASAWRGEGGGRGGDWENTYGVGVHVEAGRGGERSSDGGCK